MKLSIEILKNVYESKGYSFYDDSKPFNVNIFGIRKEVDTNKFDDYLGISFRDGDLEEVLYLFNATTDPGRYWLNHPMNTKGTAIVVPGQYKGLWAIGKHQGRYIALVQKGKIKVYRDNDRDNEHDMEVSSIEEGRFGINCHKSNPYKESYYIDKWSAGCQVLKKAGDLDILLNVVIKSSDLYGNSFTYTLFDEKDFA